MRNRLKLALPFLMAILLVGMLGIPSCSYASSSLIPMDTPAMTPTNMPTVTTTPAPNDTSPGPLPLGMPGNWKLVFTDEFDGTTLNLADWCPNWVDGSSCSEVTAPVNPNEEAAYDPAQVSISEGSLHLTLIDKPVMVNGKTYPYRSGMVQTNGKVGQTPMHQFTYGAFEARIFLPGADGKIYNWPAWWTDGQHWPTDGEMDIVEGMSGLVQYHFHSDQTSDGSGPGGDYTGWHTYGADWEKGKVIYYYDGKPVGVLDWGITDAPMYLILNYATGGCCSGETVAPGSMLIDYVHVWQH